MTNRARWLFRRLGAVTAALALATTLSFAAGVPAQAAPPGGCVHQFGYNVDSNQNIHAHRLWACENGDIIPLSVSIQRFVSPGVWETVASGTGFISYFCNGHPLNRFRVPPKEPFFNTCG